MSSVALRFMNIFDLEVPAGCWIGINRSFHIVVTRAWTEAGQ